MVVEVTGTALASNDHLQVGGGVTISGGELKVYFAGVIPQTGQSFPIIQYQNNLIGSFPTVSVLGLEPGFQFAQQVISPGVFGLIALNDGEPLSPPPATFFTEIHFDQTGGASFTVNGTGGTLTTVQTSSDLKKWSMLRRIDPSGQGSPIADRRSGIFPALFYRAVSP